YWWTDFYKHLWGDEYNQIDAPLKWPTRAQTVQLIKQESSLSWIDDITTTEQESLSDLISQSFTTALGKLQNEFGDNRSHWKWGCVNNTHIGHVGQIPGFGRHVFIGGGAESINAIDGS